MLGEHSPPSGCHVVRDKGGIVAVDGTRRVEQHR